MKRQATLGLLLIFVLMFSCPRVFGAAGADVSARFNDWQDHGCHMSPGAAGGPAPEANGAGGNQAGCPTCPSDDGMPRWWVDEPYVNLHISDTPLSYRTSSGQEMSFRFFYKQRYRLPDQDQCPNFYARTRPVQPGVKEMRAYGLTNASWSHNWMMDVILWDSEWENACLAPPCAGRSFPVFSHGHEALVFGPDGAISYYQTLQVVGGYKTPSDSLSQVKLLALSSLGYPVITNNVADTNGIYWGNPNNGVKLVYPDGSQDIFSLAYYFIPPVPTVLGAQTTARALLTQRIDPHGRVTQLGYEYVLFTNYFNNLDQYGAYRVRYVVDCDGRTNTFHYNTSTPAHAWQVSEIADPYGRKATFTFGFTPGKSLTNGLLTSIVDAGGLATAFFYQFYQGTNTWISQMTTPYGNTGFGYYQNPDPTVTNGFKHRAICVSEPGGARQLFYYIHTNLLQSATETSPTDIPGQAFDDGASGGAQAPLYFRNTYHWGRRQFAALPTGTKTLFNNFASNPTGALNALTAADFRKAALKHWLLGGDGISVTESLSSEREPSPDPAGQTAGQRIWYNYPSQTHGPEVEGIAQIKCVAQTLPDGNSRYTLYSYYAGLSPWPGLVSANRSTWTRPDGSVGLRTNWFIYATNAIDLVTVSNSAGQKVSMGYNDNHQVNALTNALGEVTTFLWDWGSHNLYQAAYPGGRNLTLTFYPPADPEYSPFTNTTALLYQMLLVPDGLTVEITDYTNGLPRVVHTYGDGLLDRWQTNSWDDLNRLTGSAFPDGSTVSYRYNLLDLAAGKDRLDHWTFFGHDALQNLTSITNALTNVTRLEWCDCGALTAVTNALNHSVTLGYDNQGHPSTVLFADNSSLTYGYDLAGQLTSVTDGANRSVRFFYNNQGLVTTVSNAYGRVANVVYDIRDRPTIVTDADNSTVTSTFDNLGRVLTRTWQDLSSESFGYSTNGLVAYTNRNQEVTRFLRDAAGRVRAVTNANLEVVRFDYDALGNLIHLTDALNHATTWNYNEYGWLTNKLDDLGHEVFRLYYNAVGEVTNRWTPAAGITAYRHDALGNLTNIDYSGASLPTANVSLAYDAINQLTNLIDAAGITGFDYTSNGQLRVEAGPWTSSALVYTYNQSHRDSLTLASPSGPAWTNVYGYDLAWRLQSLTSPAGTFGYGYSDINPASSLVASLGLPNAASISYQYDSLGRLTNTALANVWGHVLDGYGYGYDSLGLRKSITRNFGLTNNSVSLDYDHIGQLTSWTAKEANEVPRQNEQLGFGYDPANNLHLRTNGAMVQTFDNDSLNQLYHIGRSGPLTVSGNTPAPATGVTVNGSPAERYADLTFAASGQSLLDGNNMFTVIASNAYNVKVTNNLAFNLPQSITLTYDLNGNVSGDGTRVFYHDAEDRLTNVFIPAQWKTEFVYDGLGRRRIIKDYAWQSGAWAKTNESRVIFDGMLPIQERDGNNNVKVSYTRGLDLSGGLQDAGGIGGLLARTDSNGSTFYHSDGLGNVTALMDGNQNIVGRYLYDPFGHTLAQWGPLAEANTMRFSSMPVHRKSGLVGYWGRFYDPALQRLMQRDPVGELGGINLYGFVGNSPNNQIDPLGLSWYNPYSWIYDPEASASYPPLPLPSPESKFSNLAMVWDETDTTSPRFNGKTAGEAVEEVGKAVPRGLAEAAMWMGGVGEEKTIYEGITAAENAGFFAKLWGKCKNLFGGKSKNVADKFSRTPKSLMDEMVLDAARQGKGQKIIDNLGDPKFKGMEKWSYGETSANGLRSEVHYVRDPKTGELMDFKFKHHAETYK